MSYCLSSTLHLNLSFSARTFSSRNLRDTRVAPGARAMSRRGPNASAAWPTCRLGQNNRRNPVVQNRCFSPRRHSLDLMAPAPLESSAHLFTIASRKHFAATVPEFGNRRVKVRMPALIRAQASVISRLAISADPRERSTLERELALFRIGGHPLRLGFLSRSERAHHDGAAPTRARPRADRLVSSKPA